MVTSDEFWGQFEGLAVPDGVADSPTFVVGSPHGAFRLGRNRDGLPCLLVECADSDGLVTPRLKHLRIRPSASCELVTSGGHREHDTLTIIEPVDVAPDLSRFLVGSFHSVMLAAGGRPNLGDLQRLVSEIAEVFRGLSSLSTMTAQALWSELFIIASCSDPERLARAWHRDFEERWDFVDGAQRLEVKSNAQPSNRRHHFTLDQVCPPDGLSVYVASVTVPRGGTVSIGDLVNRVRGLLTEDPQTLSRVEQTVAAALGDGADQALGLAFDEDVARESLRVYTGPSIPKPSCERDPGVGRVEFVADLDFSAWLTTESVDAQGGLIAALRGVG